MQYNTKSHAKFSLKVHLIFVIKYRHKILVDRLNDEIKRILIDSCTNEFRIDTIETDVDHVHMLIDYDPKLSISMIVRRLKQFSTFEIWKKCPILLNMYFWKRHIFWSKGYFVCSVGNASIETIKKYIENQG